MRVGDQKRQLDRPFAELLHNVRRLLQVGVVLNTSFNLHGFPLVCTPREAIEVFNVAGPKFKQAGITFTYHCHGYEFQPFGDGTLFDLIVKETKPDAVFFELDVFWAQQGGANPAKLLEKHGSRFKLMHVKDLKKGAEKNSTGAAPDETSVPVGEGEVDWKSVLKAAEQAHVEHYFIEDEVVIERKTYADFATSLADGRLFPQAAALTAPTLARVPRDEERP